MRTDVADRAQQMLQILEDAGFVNPLGRGVFHPYDPEEVPSTRERRYLGPFSCKSNRHGRCVVWLQCEPKPP